MSKEKIEFLAQIVGVLAVIIFTLSYLQKKRKNIIIFNATSRVLYIVQYIMLGAFSGAVLDVMGTVSSVVAGKKETPFIKKHIKLIFTLVNVLIIASGLYIYEKPLDICPIIGVLLHTSAFWISDEKIIRRVSFLGSPFWLTYNLLSRAYGSSVGDVLSMVSIGISMIRYDVKKK